MDNTILDIIKAHNLLGNKNNLQKNQESKEKFIRNLDESENIGENSEIYERINRDRCNDEKIDRVVVWLGRNNSDKETIVEFMRGLKISILDFIKSLINIYNYKSKLIKRIEAPQIISEFMPPLQWTDMEKYKKLEAFFRDVEGANRNRNKINEDSLDTIIFNRITEVFVKEKINDWENILKLEYSKDGNNTDSSICEFIKGDASIIDAKFDEIKDNIDINKFQIKSDEVIFKDYNGIMDEKKKKMFLYFLLILEVTNNINYRYY